MLTHPLLGFLFRILLFLIRKNFTGRTLTYYPFQGGGHKCKKFAFKTSSGNVFFEGALVGIKYPRVSFIRWRGGGIHE